MDMRILRAKFFKTWSYLFRIESLLIHFGNGNDIIWSSPHRESCVMLSKMLLFKKKYSGNVIEIGC